MQELRKNSNFEWPEKEGSLQPDWTVDMSSMPERQEVISIIGDTILITGLISYSTNSTGINNLLQSDSVIIKPLKEWDYIKKMKPNELIFDTITYAFSTKNGNQIGQLLDYPPKQDISKYPEDDCWSSCKGLKLATTGCTCEYELAHNYKGYQIMLSYYTRHFKEETSSQKLKILVYKKGVLISEQKISNYNNIIDSQIVYFTSVDAVYFYHFYSDYMGKNKEQVLAKFSFEKLIEKFN